MTALSDWNTSRPGSPAEDYRSVISSLNAVMVVALAPLFGMLWSSLGRRKPQSRPADEARLRPLFPRHRICVHGGRLHRYHAAVRASMFWLTMTYLLHTIGELCMSPTGLAFVTRVSPVHSVSLLLASGTCRMRSRTRSAARVAGSIEAIESGDISLPWYGWFKLGGQADFFLMFVVISVIAGTIMLLLKPLLERLLAGRRA